MFTTYIQTTAIVIVLIVLTFILLIFLPTAPSYFPIETCKELLLFSDETQLPDIKKEILEFIKHDTVIYKSDYVSRYTYCLPIVYDKLRYIPNIVCAYINTIVPDNTSEIYQKNINISNDKQNSTITCIIPIQISSKLKSYITTSGTKKFFTPGEIIIHDHTREYYFTNNHKRNNTILLCIVIERPLHLANGIFNINNHDKPLDNTLDNNPDKPLNNNHVIVLKK